MMWSSPGVHVETASGMVGVSSLGDASAGVLLETSGQIVGVSSLAAGTSFAQYVDASGTGVYVSATTARVYARLPDFMRDADVSASGEGVSGTAWGFPLLRWLACLVDQAGDIEGIVDQLADPAASALTDPSTADAAWLPWLGQLVGVSLPSPVGDVAAARSAILEAALGAPRGSKPSIAAAVSAVLGGSAVVVTDHAGGDAWQIGVQTVAADTPATLPGQPAFIWGQSTWGTASATWGNPDPVEWYLAQQDLVPAGYSIEHTTV